MKHLSLSLMSALALGSVLILSPGKIRAQAEPTAVGAGALQVGGTISFLKPSATGYLSGTNAPDSSKWNIGGAGYATFDWTYHLGIEAEVNYPTTRTSDDYLQKTYLAGIRYVYRVRRYQPYANVLFGVGSTSYDRPVAWISFPGTPSSYGVLAYGAGLDYVLSPHINIRAVDLQLQHWIDYTGGSINPFQISVGAAYRFR